MAHNTAIHFCFDGKARKVFSNTSVQRFNEIRDAKKLTKVDIENLAKDIKMWAADNRDAVGYDISLLYNGKHDHYDYVFPNKDKGDWTCKHVRKVDHNCDPHKWCEWFPEDFILGMTVDGHAYEILNYEYCKVVEAKLRQLLKAYGLYLSQSDYCYWYVTPYDDMDVEYTHWEKEKIIYLYRPNHSDDGSAVPEELNHIMRHWYALAEETGDFGSCTIGEYMEFRLNGKKYRMSSQSPYQGDYSWSAHVDTIKEMVKAIGATDVYMNYGRLD